MFIFIAANISLNLQKQFYIKCSGLSLYNVIIVCHCNKIFGNCSIKKEGKSITLNLVFMAFKMPSTFVVQSEQM